MELRHLHTVPMRSKARELSESAKPARHSTNLRSMLDSNEIEGFESLDGPVATSCGAEGRGTVGFVQPPVARDRH
jgi:hypothetical protein